MKQKAVIIGKNVDTGEAVTLDLDKLMEGGAALLANSGGGKTHLIRKICEETHVDVLDMDALQQIILDWEGDLVTLSQGRDYLVAQRDGKIPVDPRSAALLARKVLELNANIIIDLSDLEIPKRREFAKLFLEALIYTPKDLWNRRCIVVIDEAHELAPEKGYGESVALNAVVALMSQGRKRGLRGILASQRPARLAKDAMTQARNKLVGLCSWDIDKKACAKELGFTTKEQEQSLEDLDHEFYMRGPAFSKKLIKMKAGSTVTKPLESGKAGTFKPPMASEKATAALARLADLPKQAEAELRTMEDYKRKNSELQTEIMRLKAGQPVKQGIDQKEVDRLIQEGYVKGKAEAEKLSGPVRSLAESIQAFAKDIGAQAGQLSQESAKVLEAVEEQRQRKPPVRPTLAAPPAAVTRPPQVQLAVTHAGTTEHVTENGNGKPLNEKKKKVLQFLFMRQGKYVERSKIATMVGMADSGTFGTYISELKKAGYVLQSDQSFAINPEMQEEIRQVVGDIAIMTPQQAMESWLNSGQLGAGPKRIYEVVLKEQDRLFDRNELAIAAGFKDGESGTFGTYISNLHTLGLIRKVDARIGLNSDLLVV